MDKISENFIPSFTFSIYNFSCVNKKRLANNIESKPFAVAFPIQRTDIGSSCGARLFKSDSHLSSSKSGANMQ